MYNPSVAVLEVSNQFIQVTSHSEPHSRAKQVKPLNPEQGKKIQAILTAEVRHNLKNQQPASGFSLLVQGKHYNVWSHQDFPDCVFKIMSLKSAQEQAKVAKEIRQVAKKNAFTWIELPKTTVLENEEDGLYVEPKFPLILKGADHAELWARILAHYESVEASVEFKNNLEAMIEEIHQLIQQVGVWDIYHHNFEIGTDGKPYLVDFADISLKVGRKVGGLDNLASLVPVLPIVEKLIEEYSVLLPDYRSYLEEFYMDEPELMPSQEKLLSKFRNEIESQRTILKAIQAAIAYYDIKKWTQGEKTEFYPFDFNELEGEELKIARYLEHSLQKHFDENQTKNECLTLKRSLSLQPGILQSEFKYDYDAFVQVLDLFIKQGNVISWYDNRAEKKFSGYESFTIYY